VEGEEKVLNSRSNNMGAAHGKGKSQSVTGCSSVTALAGGHQTKHHCLRRKKWRKATEEPTRATNVGEWDHEGLSGKLKFLVAGRSLHSRRSAFSWRRPTSDPAAKVGHFEGLVVDELLLHIFSIGLRMKDLQTVSLVCR